MHIANKTFASCGGYVHKQLTSFGNCGSGSFSGKTATASLVSSAAFIASFKLQCYNTPANVEKKLE